MIAWDDNVFLKTPKPLILRKERNNWRKIYEVREIELSGLYYPNKFARLYLEALEDVMGKNGVNAILNLAGLSHFIDNYPPDNLDKGEGIDFAEFTALQIALEEMYGPRGGAGWRSAPVGLLSQVG